MTTETNTTPTPAATFAQFFIDRDREHGNFDNFYCSFGYQGFEFPATASEFINAISRGTTGDGDIANKAEIVGSLLLEAGNYILAAVADHQSKDWQGETA